LPPIHSDFVRYPRGGISDRIKAVGEQNICTSIVVAAELRYRQPPIDFQFTEYEEAGLLLVRWSNCGEHSR